MIDTEINEINWKKITQQVCREWHERNRLADELESIPEYFITRHYPGTIRTADQARQILADWAAQRAGVQLDYRATQHEIELGLRDERGNKL